MTLLLFFLENRLQPLPAGAAAGTSHPQLRGMRPSGQHFFVGVQRLLVAGGAGQQLVGLEHVFQKVEFVRLHGFVSRP